jgi:hypothetical protein
MTYKNPYLFKSIEDYIIGGFTMKQLSNIKTPKSAGQINEEKVLACMMNRIEFAIEDYLKDVKSAFILEGKDNAESLALRELDELIYSYLGIEVSGENPFDIATSIRCSSQYTAWYVKMKSRLDNQSDITILVGMIGNGVANVEESEETIENSVEEPNLLEILETLTKYA